ncbi:MAG TPA: hypothetical protein VED40_08860 [Azospirillaceae bacterium]|nr:hypothetical protein [Azospirillaceae bacterium]
MAFIFDPPPDPLRRALADQPDWLRRDLIPDGGAVLRALPGAEAELPSPARRFSFRMHPATELSYLWERLRLASFPVVGERSA